MNGWRAKIIQEWSGFANRTVKLYVVQDGGAEMQQVLFSDGNIYAVPRDQIYEPENGATAGISLPQQAVDAIFEAFAEYEHKTPPSEQENKVLREALDIERARVGSVLDRFLTLAELNGYRPEQTP